jgi:DNA-binding response OmpR family regulator
MELLILNTDEFFLDKAKRYYFKRGFQIHLADNGVDGLVHIVNHQPQAIITNVDLNALSGIELYRLVKSKSSFAGRFYFISNKIDDDEFDCYNERHKIYSEKTAFNRILSLL